MISKKKQKLRQHLFEKGLKHCSNSDCLKTNPQPHNNFSCSVGAWDGFQTRCKTCKSDTPHADKYNELFSKGLKICNNPDCPKANPQPLNDFNKHSKGRDGYNPRCKTCVNNTTRTYHRTKRGKLAQQIYNRSDKGKDASRKHRGSPKQKAAKRRYTQSPRGKEKYRKYTIIRRTRKTQAGGTYTTDEWYNLCGFYNFHCLMCNQEFSFDQLTVDHVHPVSKGGTSFIWNLQPLCSTCNKRKGAKEIDYRQTLPDWIKRDREIYHQLSLFEEEICLK